MSGKYRYLVARRGLPASVEYMAGQDVETYELLAPLPARTQPLPGVQVHWNAHEQAAEWAERAAPAIRSREWRLLARKMCTCGQSLVTVAVDPQGTRWALITRPEHIPTAFRRPEHTAEPAAWPLHREPTGMPHVDMARCRSCGVVYCVAITADEVTLIPTRPTYGARAAP